MKNHANRGKRLEQLIDLFGARYASTKKAYLIKSPPQVKHLRSLKNGQFVACYAAKGQPDYLLLADGVGYLFDAKEFKGNRFPFSSLHPHQFNALVRWQECGGKSALVFGASDHHAYFVAPLEAFKDQYLAWVDSKAKLGNAKRGQASLSFEWMLTNSIPWADDGYLSALKMI